MVAYNAHHAYKDTIRSTTDPRNIERKILEQNAARLQSTQKRKESHFTEYVEALHENLRLWLLIGGEVASEHNQLSKDLRGGLLNLAEFTRTHTQKVLSSDISVDVLIDINRSVAAGLRGQLTPIASMADIVAEKPSIHDSSIIASQGEFLCPA